MTGIKYSINGKDVFNKTYFSKLAKLSNSDELYEIVTKAMDGAPKIEISRDNTQQTLTQIEFDVLLEEEKPFLKILLDNIIQNLSIGEVVSDIQHLPFRERYTFENNGNSCVVDFLYDGNGFFGSVQPIEAKCTHAELLARIKEIINNLKVDNYVIQ